MIPIKGTKGTIAAEMIAVFINPLPLEEPSIEVDQEVDQDQVNEDPEIDLDHVIGDHLVVREETDVAAVVVVIDVTHALEEPV